jgi:hypothetical protein
MVSSAIAPSTVAPSPALAPMSVAVVAPVMLTVMSVPASNACSACAGDMVPDTGFDVMPLAMFDE